MFSTDRAQTKGTIQRLKRLSRNVRRPRNMDHDSIQAAYKRWAPVYDSTFGRVAAEGRKQAVAHLNKGAGHVLEVGVGTGLSLPDYKPHLDVTGIDLSREMLAKAREKVARKGLSYVNGLFEMDASDLTFEDGSFDAVVAMYVMTVVPEPEEVMHELARVCRPGGEILLVNHFSEDDGARGWIERRMAPFGDTLGWRPVFEKSRVMVCPQLELVESRRLKPFGLFTMLRFRKREEAQH